MPGVYATLEVAEPAGVYGFYQSLPSIIDDRMDIAASSPATFIMKGVQLHPEAGILTLQSKNCIVDTLLADWTVSCRYPPGGGTIISGPQWMQMGYIDSQAIVLADSTAGATFSAVCNSSMSADASFFLRLSRNQPSPTVVPGPTTYNTVIQLGVSALDTYQATLTLASGAPPQVDLVASVGGLSPVSVQGQKVQNCDDLLSGARMMWICWTVYPGLNLLVVDINGGQERMVCRAPSGVSVAAGTGTTWTKSAGLSIGAGPIMISGVNGTASIQLQPYGYVGDPSQSDSDNIVGTFQSPPRQLWDVYAGNNNVLINPPDQSGIGVTVGVPVSDTSGQSLEYLITLTASTYEFSGAAPPPYLAASSPVVQEVQVVVPPSVISNLGQSGSVLTFDDTYMTDFTEHEFLERVQDGDGGYCVYRRSQLGINFSNYQGVFSDIWPGLLACSFSRGLTEVGTDGLNYPITPQYPFITGWGGVSQTLAGSQCNERYDFVIEDRSWQMRVKDVGRVPYFDGWCPFAACQFLLNFAEIENRFIGAEFQTCLWGVNPTGCTHVKLPIGTGTSPKFGFAPTIKFWDAFTKIAGWYHWLVWWDKPTDGSESQIHAGDYFPTIYLTPYRGYFVNQEGMFDPSLSVDEQDPTCFMGIQGSLRQNIDLSGLRSSVSFYGLDAGTGQVQGTHLNADDVMGIGWTQKMIGFHWDLCDVDTRFVDPDATANHAVTVLEKCLIPVVTFEHDGYFLPCINVLDNYDIDVSKVTMSGPPDFWRLSCEERAAQWFTEAGSGDGQTRKATQHIVGRSWYNV